MIFTLHIFSKNLHFKNVENNFAIFQVLLKSHLSKKT